MSEATLKQEKRFVGIVKLDPAEERPGIERLGPPPGNTDTLVRAGMGWVVGIANVASEFIDPRITLLQLPPMENEALLALRRELAFQWLHQTGLFAQRTDSQKPPIVPHRKKFSIPYIKVEQMFVANAASLWPGLHRNYHEKGLGEPLSEPDSQFSQNKLTESGCSDRHECVQDECKTCLAE